jgi:TetR/AcrR family transcriptional regulator
MIDAARRLVEVKGTSFTAQELAAEAGVALQTFYRHFAGKDALLLALFEEEVAEHMDLIEERVQELPDPVTRLRFLVTVVLDSLGTAGGEAGPRFMTAEHWRLYQLFPHEIAQINQRFADILAREVRAGVAAGALRSADPASDAWMIMKLLMSVFHHHAFAPPGGDADMIAERLWSFVLRALSPC